MVRVTKISAWSAERGNVGHSYFEMFKIVSELESIFEGKEVTST